MAETPQEGPQDVNHAYVTTGRRGFSTPIILNSRPMESEVPGMEFNNLF